MAHPLAHIGEYMPVDVTPSVDTKTSNAQGSISVRAPKKTSKIDGLVKSKRAAFNIIFSKAGIKLFKQVINYHRSRNDVKQDFLRLHQDWGHYFFPGPLLPNKHILYQDLITR